MISNPKDQINENKGSKVFLKKKPERKLKSKPNTKSKLTSFQRRLKALKKSQKILQPNSMKKA